MTWFFDHAAHWTERAGDALSSPFYRLSQWCYRQWRRREHPEWDRPTHVRRPCGVWREDIRGGLCECGQARELHAAFNQKAARP